jgi:hypothetical protein
MQEMLERYTQPIPQSDRLIVEPRPEFAPLREVAAEVAVDCRIAPREYLDEVHVPVGGE